MAGNMGMNMGNQGMMMQQPGTPQQQQQQQMHQLQQQLQMQQQQQQQQHMGGPPQQMLQQAHPNPGMTHGNPPAQMMDQNKLDHVSKVKTLVWPLKESLGAAMKSASQNFSQNSAIDVGNLKSGDITIPRFDKHLEEFYAICDQMELNLRAAIECASVSSNSSRYVPTPLSLVKSDPAQVSGSMPDTLSYPQYLSVARMQVSHATEIRDALLQAASSYSNES